MVDLKSFTRKRYIVRPEYQLRVALSFFALSILYSLVLAGVIFIPLYKELDTALSIEEQARASAVILYLHKRIWVGFFLAALLAGITAIFTSHRLVGPMYRFERTVEELISGNYGIRIKIRKGDEFKEMEALLNRLAGDLDLKKGRDQQFYSDAMTKLETIRAMLEAEGAEYPEDVKRLTQELIDGLATKERK